MSQDLRKWFINKHAKDTGNGDTSKQAKPSTPEKPPVVQGVNESSSRRKTSKYFTKDAQSVKDEMEAEQVSEKKAQTGSTGSANARPPSVKETHKHVNNDDDFVTPTSRKGSVDAPPSKKLKSGSGKGVARQIIDDIDEEGETVNSNAKSTGSGMGRGAKGSAVTRSSVESMNADENDVEDEDTKDTQSVKPCGRGRGGRGAPAGGRGRGGGVRGGFMNFGDRKDPPHKGEKEVSEGAPDCLNGLTYVISGTFDSLEREEAEDLIKRHGGRVTDSLSKKKNYLLCDDDSGGQKSKKAKELGTSFLTEDGLFDIIRASIKSKKPVDKVAPSPPKKSPQKSEKSKQAGHTVSNSGTKGLASVSASSEQKNQPSLYFTSFPLGEAAPGLVGTLERTIH